MAKIDLPRNLHPADYSSYVADLDYEDVYNIMAFNYLPEKVFTDDIYYYAIESLEENGTLMQNIERDFRDYYGVDGSDEDGTTEEFIDYYSECATNAVQNYTSIGIYTLPMDVMSDIMSDNDCKEVAKYFDTISGTITVDDVIDYCLKHYNFSNIESIAEKYVDQYLEEFYGN